MRTVWLGERCKDEPECNETETTKNADKVCQTPENKDYSKYRQKFQNKHAILKDATNESCNRDLQYNPRSDETD